MTESDLRGQPRGQGVRRPERREEGAEATRRLPAADSLDAVARGARALRRRRGRAAVAAQLTALGRMLGPGVIDMGMASMASFAASAYAARYLETSALGAYALFFLAVSLLSTVPRALISTPATMTAVEWPRRDRLQILPHSIGSAGLLAVVTLPALAVPALLTRGAVGDSTLFALALTAAATACTMPLQVEAQMVLHLAERSAAGAVASATRMVVTVTSIVSLHLAGVDTGWIPLGSLAAGNVASLGVALTVAARTPSTPQPLPHWSAMIAAGRLLLPSGLVVPAGSFAVLAIVAHLASTEAVGHAEAARVIAMPVVVFGSGLGTVLRPRMMEAGLARTGSRAARISWVWAGLCVLATLSYLVVVGWRHPLNPMAYLVPAAYEQQGLAALQIVALSGATISIIPQAALLGARRSAPILATNAMRAVCRVLVAVPAAAVAGAYAVPLAAATSEIAGLVIGTARARRLFDAEATRRTDVVPPGVAVSQATLE